MQQYYIKVKKKDKIINAIKNNITNDYEKALKLILQGSVWIGKQRIKNPEYEVNDELIIVFMPEYKVIEYELNEENIVYEDDYMLIVYKEAGINSCPSPSSDIDCLSHGVNKYYEKKGILYNSIPVNRLDKPVQGPIFFAKDKKTSGLLHNMFKKKKIRKLYIAATEKFNLTKKTFFIRDKLEWKGKIQKAATYIKFLTEDENFYYFLVYPLTGRTHQIRRHFAKYLIPIYGDTLYGLYKNCKEVKLYCFYYKFIHPITGEKKEIIYFKDEKLTKVVRMFIDIFKIDITNIRSKHGI